MLCLGVSVRRSHLAPTLDDLISAVYSSTMMSGAQVCLVCLFYVERAPRDRTYACKTEGLASIGQSEFLLVGLYI